MNHGYYNETIESLRHSGNLRRIPADRSAEEGTTDLSSNDYLGLGVRTDLQEQFMAERDNRMSPMTSSASRLLATRQNDYGDLETLLGRLYDRPALLFNSGYHANTGMISSLAAGKSIIVADKLVHASIIDGIVLSKAAFTRFPHNDFDRLERILAKESPLHERVIVAVESVYSMDGDRADIDRLTELKRRYPNVLLYVDEAHGVGVEGPQGLGLSIAASGYGDIDVIAGTFGKAYASSGAFCVTSTAIREYLVNRARSFIFSTAIPPITARWTRFMIEQSLGMDAERDRLAALGTRLHEILSGLPGKNGVASHIQPYITGSPESAVTLSGRLLEEGFKVLPIRTPTVPPGTDRLRISLSAALTADDIESLGNALTRLTTCN
ncbi:MAG: 8-amino-7-oxononanoate synthase [Duncaniella sp.]|nr:8-amino-7-oxononanoate synthase [Duncaniella sp.]